MHSLGDRNRIRILLVLARGPMTVGEVSSVLGLTQPNASRHLKAMHQAGLLSRRGDAGRAWYSIDRSDPLVSAIASLLDSHRERLGGSDSDMDSLALCYERRSEQAREFFRRRADRWEEISAGLPDPGTYAEDVSSMLGSGGTAVELGCGTGGMIPLLARSFGMVIAVDSSPEMLMRARRAAPGADLRLGMLEHVPVGDACADAALAHMVLHHLADPRRAFPEAARILKPGGRLVVADLESHSREDFRLEQGDLWAGFEEEELTGWAVAAGLVPAGSLSRRPVRLCTCRKEQI